jgi:hypothetical protein
MTTENCFGHMTLLSARLTGKNSTNGSPDGSFHQPFFLAISSLKVQCFLFQVKQHIFLGSAHFNDSGKGILP